MDLSKIPEPSEYDLSDARFSLSHRPYSSEDRIIAHLLRHGSVLAKSLKELVYSAATPDERAAISFFEKFGGEA